VLTQAKEWEQAANGADFGKRKQITELHCKGMISDRNDSLPPPKVG